MFFDAIKNTTREFAIFDSNNYGSFAALHYFGTAFLNLAGQKQNEVFFVEDIAHQSGHTIYYTLTHDSSKFLKPHQDSLLRDFTNHPSDKRNIHGAFHGLFTYTTILHCLNTALQNKWFKEEKGEDALARIGFYYKKFEQDLVFQGDSRILTNEGWRYYDMFQSSFTNIKKQYYHIIKYFDYSNQDYSFNFEKFTELNPYLSSFTRCLCLIASLFWCLITPACAQSATEKQPKKKEISSQDSIKLNYYFEQLEALPLFSQKRGIFIDSVLTLLPDNAYAWQQRAMPLLKQKKYEIAMPYLNKAVDLDPKRYLDYRAFIKCIFSKDYTSAIVDFKNAQKQFGTTIVMDHSYDFYMGLCYLQLNKLDSAEYLIAKTIEEEKKNRSDESWIHFMHWFYYGITKFEKDEFENAILYFDKSLKSYPQFSDAKYYKAICLENLKKEKEAFDLMTQALGDCEKGYTINEDNAIYEVYPYQVNKFSIKAYIDRLKQGK